VLGFGDSVTSDPNRNWRPVARKFCVRSEMEGEFDGVDMLHHDESINGSWQLC
jgi:hypothetical protein